MARFVALLYSIVLPGNARLKMADLRDVAGAAGLGEARTVGASGNLIFAARAGRSPAALENALEARFAAAFGKAVPIIVRRAEDFAALPARNPFGAAHHPQRISVRVMREGYAPGVIEALRPYVGDEDVAIVAGDLWIGFRGPPAQSRLLAAVATRKLAAPGTFRTLAAISRIAAAALAG
jgi:uncharacterized protein (DUF1697 family)